VSGTRPRRPGRRSRSLICAFLPSREVRTPLVTTVDGPRRLRKPAEGRSAPVRPTALLRWWASPAIRETGVRLRLWSEIAPTKDRPGTDRPQTVIPRPRVLERRPAAWVTRFPDYHDSRGSSSR